MIDASRLPSLQAVLNYRRKSTEGFAVGMMVFDLVGGCASLLQVRERRAFKINKAQQAQDASEWH